MPKTYNSNNPRGKGKAKGKKFPSYSFSLGGSPAFSTGPEAPTGDSSWVKDIKRKRGK